MKKTELENEWKVFLATKKNENKQRLVEHYYGTLVQHIARKLAKKFKYKVSVPELSSYGTEGLYKALDAYDSTRKIKFDTYAYTRIWGSMIDGIREEDWIPRSVRMRQSLIEEARRILEAEHQEKVTEDEILKLAGIDKSEYHRNAKKFKVMSLSSIETNNFDCEEDENKKDFNAKLVATNIPSSDGHILRREFLNKLIGKDFTQLERKIVYYYYYENLTMREISAKMEISESRISQMHQDILRRLKTRIKLNPTYFGREIVSVIRKCNSRNSLV
jgi:RNA polymerase sigma factor for flagellar operon FliA